VILVVVSVPVARACNEYSAKALGGFLEACCAARLGVVSGSGKAVITEDEDWDF
jgi:hypothetical protein